jgi:hypothetical protein
MEVPMTGGNGTNARKSANIDDQKPTREEAPEPGSPSSSEHKILREGYLYDGLQLLRVVDGDPANEAGEDPDVE